MANLVTDTFNRANSAVTMGNADTGQPWLPQLGTWGINTNQAYVAIVGGGTILNNSKTVIDAGAGGHNAIAQVTVNNLTSAPALIFHYVDANNFMALQFRADFFIWTYYEITGGVATDIHFFNGGGEPPPVVGDVMKVVLCDNPVPNLELWQNSFNLFTANISHPAPFTTSTLYGLGGSTIAARFDNFTVDENEACPTSRADWVIPSLIWTAEGTVTSPPGVETMRFDEGLGSSWYLCAPVTDSGSELRSKVIKSVRATGKLTNASAMIYGFDVEQAINVSDLETGTRSNTKMITRPQVFEDSTEVAQTKRKQVNVKNAVLHTVRLEGDDTGETTRDRIDEIVYEVADEGVRR